MARCFDEYLKAQLDSYELERKAKLDAAQKKCKELETKLAARQPIPVKLIASYVACVAVGALLATLYLYLASAPTVEYYIQYY